MVHGATQQNLYPLVSTREHELIHMPTLYIHVYPNIC